MPTCECGVFGDIEELVNKRLEHLRKGNKLIAFTVRRGSAESSEMVRKPLPDGGFVTSFTDVTEHIESQTSLKEKQLST